MSFETTIKAKFKDVVRGRADMHPYQDGPEGAVQFLRRNPFSALFIDMGMGKSISSLTVISELIAEFAPEGEKILIIAPLRVATDTWPTEIGLWQHTAWMNYTLIRPAEDDPRLIAARAIDRAKKGDRSWDRDLLECDGLSEKEIRKQLGHVEETKVRHEIMTELARSPATIHIINREQVEWLVYFWKGKWPYRTVFIDESSSFKDHRTDRFKALAKVRQTPGLILRMHLLTATPASETYEHLFAQLYLLDLGKRLGKNITAYRDEFFTYNRWSMKYKLRPGAEEQILDKIKDICLVMKAKDHLPRTEPTIVPHKVKLAVTELERIKRLERDFVVDLPDGTEIEAKSAAILSSMLLQMASGSVYETIRLEDFETGDLKKVKKVHNLHDHKIEALKEIYEECQAQGKPLLVAYFFQSSLAKLKKAFPKAVTMDSEGKCVKQWNTGKIPMLLIHPQSAGHGLNLQYGSSILCFYDLIYSLEYYLQTIGRLDRQGQKDPVVVRVLIAEGTRDEDVFSCLCDKNDAQEKLFRILKRLIKQFRENAL